MAGSIRRIRTMKKIGKDILFGVLFGAVYIAIELLFHLCIVSKMTLSSKLVCFGFVWMILPAFLIAFVFAWILKTNTFKDARLRGIIYASILFLYYLTFGLAAGMFLKIFGRFEIYALFIFTFLGPVCYVTIRKAESKIIK